MRPLLAQSERLLVTQNETIAKMRKDLCDIHGKIGILVNMSSLGGQQISAGCMNFTEKSACDSDSAKSLRTLCQKLESAYSGSSVAATAPVVLDADTLESVHSCLVSAEPLLVSQLSVRSFSGPAPLEAVGGGNNNDDTQKQLGWNYSDGYVAINATQVSEQCCSPSATPPRGFAKAGIGSPTGVVSCYRIKSPVNAFQANSGSSLLVFKFNVI